MALEGPFIPLEWERQEYRTSEGKWELEPMPGQAGLLVEELDGGGCRLMIEHQREGAAELVVAVVLDREERKLLGRLMRVSKKSR